MAFGGVTIALYGKQVLVRQNISNHHFIARKCAGFVGAYDRYRAQRFYGGQPSHNHIAASHGLYANRQCNGQYRRQALWNGGYRQAHHHNENNVKIVVSQKIAVQEQNGCNA